MEKEETKTDEKNQSDRKNKVNENQEEVLESDNNL